MKISILALLAVTSGIRLRDPDDLQLPTLTDENDVKIDLSLAEIRNKYNEISKNDDNLIETFEK